MNGLIESKCITYKKHVIQVFEDWWNQRCIFIEGKTWANSINNAKQIINKCCQQ